MTSPSDIKGLVETVLIDAAQIIDTAKREWAAEGQWSEWDQGVRDRITQALASISSREEGAATERLPVPLPTEAAEFVMQYGSRCRDCADHDGICPSSRMACDPNVQRLAVRNVIDALNYGLRHGFIGCPDPHPLTALLTRWDDGESVGGLITQYLRGEGDWGPVRVLVGSLGSVACSAEPSLASRVSDAGSATPSEGGE